MIKIIIIIKIIMMIIIIKTFDPKYGCLVILMAPQDKLGGSLLARSKEGHESQIRPQRPSASSVPC